MKLVKISLYCILKSATVVFQWVLRVNSKSTYIMNIFLRLLKNKPVFLSLNSLSVLVMHVSVKRLYAAKFAAGFYGF